MTSDSRSIWAILGIALLLRLHGIGSGPVWVDEANGILTAGQPLPVLLENLGRDSSPPLYYLFLHAWMAWVGDGPVALRLPSAAAGLGLVAAVHAVGRRHVSRAAGLWGAFVVATSPAQIFYAQQARMYALLSLLALASVAFLVRTLESQRLRHLVAFAAATTAALYTHNFAFHLGVVHAALIALSGRLFRRIHWWVLAFLAVALVYAPWVPSLLRQLENEDHYAWFLPLWHAYGPLGAAANTFRSFSPAGEFLMYEYSGAPSWLGIPAVAGAALAALGAVAVARRCWSRGRVAALWLPAYLLLPMASAIALSGVLTPHYVPGRVDQMLFPAFALLAGAGAACLRPRAVGACLAAGLLCLAFVTKGVYQPDYRAFPGFAGSDRELAEAVARELRPGDVIVCTGLTRASLEYYLSHWGVEATILSYPRSTARHLGAQNDWKLVRDPAFLKREAKIVIERARARAGPEGRLLVLRAALRTNDFLSNGMLESLHGVHDVQRLGRYVQAGTEERILLSRGSLGGGG